jgi:methyl-accepting chemotaxis protein
MAGEDEANLKKLEEEKRALEEKNKGLAKVIELTSKQNTQQQAASKGKPKPEADAKISNSTQTALDELRNSMKTIKKSLKESIKGPAEKHEEMKKMVTDMETKIKDIDKISALETKLADVEKKVAEQVQKAPSSLSNLFGGFGAGKEEAGRPKGAPRNIGQLMKHIDGIKEGIDTRMLNMERRVDSLRHKLGKKNLQRLETLTSSQQDISDNLIPRRVREEVEKILSTFSFEVEDMAESAKSLADNVERSNESLEEILVVMKDLQKRTDTMERVTNEMRSGYQQTSLTVNTLAGKMEKMDIDSKELEQVLKEADRLTEKVEDVEKSVTKIESDTHMKNVIRSELSQISKPPPAPPKPEKPKKRRRARKTVKKAARKARRRTVAKEPAKPKPPRKRRKPAVAAAPALSRNERIEATLRRLEEAYVNGLISKERYQRISKKLKRLKQLRT